MGSISEPATNRLKINDSHIHDLHTLLPNSTLLLPTSGTAYAESIARWSSAASKPAGVCLLPTTAEEISTAVKYASENHLDLAVCGGGHSTAGTSSTQGGLLIDLRAMRGVSIDPAKLTITAQGGCTWADVDSASTAVGLCTVGGTVSNTGVGGLILGGGYGFLTGEHGLVIDNLLSGTVVLADGRIVIVSANENTDLFWAIRGAGQNFGITVSFTLRAHPVPDDGWFFGMLFFPPTQEIVQNIVAKLNEYFIPGNPTFENGKLAGGLGTVQVPSSENSKILQPAILVALVYRGTEASGRDALSSLLNLQPIINTMAHTHDYKAVNAIYAVPTGMRVSMKGAAYRMPIRADFVMEVLDSFKDFIAETPDAAASQVLWELMDPRVLMERSNTIPSEGGVDVHDTENGGGAFAGRGWHYNTLIAPFWNEEANDAKCRGWARKVADMFKEEVKRSEVEQQQQQQKQQPNIDGDDDQKKKRAALDPSRHSSGVMIYGNYDQYDERARDVFGGNYNRLRTLKQRYDPGNLFDKLFAITPVK